MMATRVLAYLQNWNMMRLLRFAIGIMAMVQAVELTEWLLGLAALLFAGMAVFNVGCCASGNCSVRRNVQTSKLPNETTIVYEEIIER